MAFQVSFRLIDRSRPDKTEITATGWNWQPGDRVRGDARAMKVELDGAKPVSPATAHRYDLRPQHVAIKGVGTLPVGDVYDTVIESDVCGHWRPPTVKPRPYMQ